ncbi:MAG TPA: ABC transporter ATP-binding protein [Candidatus Limnocylindrales bacterium]|jgi:ABC-2 type transport system ATP-binding protein|nr:ABC transporter ATP-binding protein [Candidatus Limnocylindrales bacterium]
MSAVVQVDRLTKRYNGSLAVAGLELNVEQGEIFGLVGPNGAGKTTTLKMLATLLVPSAGDALIAGYSIRRQPDAVRQLIGYMPDTFGVYDDMRVWEYLDFFGRCYGLPAGRRRQMIGDLLELVDLANKREAYVQDLSRGMQQRLCLAHALVHDPQVLLLDEPASGLDPRARVELRELLRELRALGKTILISSHILPELEELCTSLAIIDHGRVLASGKVEDIHQAFRAGGVYLLRPIGEAGLMAAEALLAGLPEVASVARRPDGQLEIALRGDEEAAARLVAALVGDGVRVAAFAPAASDLEELFLQITDVEPSAVMPGVQEVAA